MSSGAGRAAENSGSGAGRVAVGRGLAWRAAYLAAAAGIFLMDQASKAWAVRALKRTGESVTLIGGVLDLSYAENPGVAFGQMQGGGSFGRWFLAALAVAAGTAVLVYFFRTPRTDDRLLGACALLLAGIVGNLTDRVRLGYVIDFIEFHISSFSWPTFNVADASICVGAFLLALDLIFEGKRERENGKTGKRERGKAESVAH